jgi:predicted aldo/keto reductase-like oxidoreductase
MASARERGLNSDFSIMRLKRAESTEMKYNRVAKTDVYLSAVGFGTCQLRLVPERQAMEILKRGFHLGVNWVHVAPDYDGTQNLVAGAIREYGKDVTMLSQGYGDMAHFEYLFENTCRVLGKSRLEMFGIACIDDREYLGEDVWGPTGMVAYLEKKKAEGRLGGIFCSTHGTAEYVSRLIGSGRFDAVMMAYNLLGFHLLSYCPTDHKKIENISLNKRKVFPLALKQDVSLLIMKPLAGGLVSKSMAFPPYHVFATPSKAVSAGDQLQAILENPAVTAVVPGTASVAEADENARAGHGLNDVENKSAHQIRDALKTLQKGLCNRCGFCERLCSRNLPVSWLFRDAYISNYPSETFETIDGLQYFHIHPWPAAACRTCNDKTCRCPHGIDIPNALIQVHERMLALQAEKRLPLDATDPVSLRRGSLPVRILRKEIPTSIRMGEREVCRVFLMNAGKLVWPSASGDPNGNPVVLSVSLDGKLWKKVPLRRNVPPEDRTHIVFNLKAPFRAGLRRLQFHLTREGKSSFDNAQTFLFDSELEVLKGGVSAWFRG